MQHFLVENNLPNSLDCLIIGIFENQKQIPAIIQSSEELKNIYEKDVQN